MERLKRQHQPEQGSVVEQDRVLVDGESQRRGQVLIFDDYEFTRKFGTVSTWRCCKCKTNGDCKASVSVSSRQGMPRRARGTRTTMPEELLLSQQSR